MMMFTNPNLDLTIYSLVDTFTKVHFTRPAPDTTGD
uniref:Uncharacterized protein n=1 Tax=Anguilla anguilla TaxID=7936 RepID=A0A0E9Y046_ANGAN